MSEIKVNLDKLTKEEREQLLQLVEKGNKVESKVWTPKDGDSVWILSVWGEICIRYSKEYYIYYKAGQLYPTEEACKIAIEETKVIKELQDFATVHNDKIDWKNNYSYKYSIVYDYKFNKVNTVINTIFRGRDIYFSSKEIANQAIEQIGEERIKKYYLRIED